MKRKVMWYVAMPIFFVGIIATYVGQCIIGSGLFGFGLTFAGVILAFGAFLLIKKCRT